MTFTNPYSTNALALCFTLLCFSGCGSKEQSGNSFPTRDTTNGASLPSLSGKNVMTVTVNGSNCATNSYLNKPCVSVTICPPGSSSGCQTISDILLDTGSYGLRVFKSVIDSTLYSALTAVSVDNKPVGECVQFGDGSSDWGPVVLANVILASETGVQVPIHVIDSKFASIPKTCGTPESAPADAGFNGILGVGLFSQDCGNYCAKNAGNNLYFTCASASQGASCSGTAIPLTSQVQNIVPLLSEDNNGIILELPDISLEGSAYANGYLVLGIGTQSNNQPGDVTSFSASSSTGEFKTSFNGNDYESFLDSGSNGLFFEGPNALILPDCGSKSSSAAGFYCPDSNVKLSAVTVSSSGSPSVNIPFYIGNALGLSAGNSVFKNLGANISIGGSKIFDWGLPFYLGRNVYQGFESTKSSLGSGTYWAY